MHRMSASVATGCAVLLFFYWRRMKRRLSKAPEAD
jgi:hypothetical protein